MNLSMKTIILFIIFALCCVCLFMIHDLTIEPDVVSSVHQLGLFIIFPFVMFFTLFLMSLFFITKDILGKFPRTKPLFIVFFLTVAAFSIVKATTESVDLIEKLGGGPDEVQSVIYNLPWLNEYTYTLFFNMPIFLIITSVTFLCSIPFIHHHDRETTLDSER